MFISESAYIYFKFIYSTGKSISVVKDHVNEGDTLKYLVSPTGANTFTYQWFQNGNLINGATEYTFIIKGIVASDTGLYTCQITDTCGTKMYNIAYVYINSLIHNITGYVVYDNVTQTPLSKIWVYLYQGETKLTFQNRLHRSI